MALVQWHGSRFYARPIERLPEGWIMESLEHGARVSPGTRILVQESEIVDADAMPSRVRTLADLEADLADERKRLPSIQRLLDQYREKMKEAAPRDDE